LNKRTYFDVDHYQLKSKILGYLGMGNFGNNNIIVLTIIHKIFNGMIFEPTDLIITIIKIGNDRYSINW
jgi:hypothetical protein